MDEFIISAIFFAGGFTHAILGFGFPLITTPLISLFLDLRMAILVTLYPTLLNNIVNILYGGNSLKIIKRYFVLAFSGIGGSFLGSWMIIRYPAELFKVLLSLTLMLYLYQQKKKIVFHWLQKDSWFVMGVLGFIGGITGGTVNVALVVFLIYLLNQNLEKNQIIQALNFCFILGKLAQIVVFHYYDFFTAESFFSILKPIMATLPGILLGFKLRKYIDYERFKKIVQFIIFIFTVLLFVQGSLYVYRFLSE